jgi:hypothetical protein
MRRWRSFTGRSSRSGAGNGKSSGTPYLPMRPWETLCFLRWRPSRSSRFAQTTAMAKAHASGSAGVPPAVFRVSRNTPNVQRHGLPEGRPCDVRGFTRDARIGTRDARATRTTPIRFSFPPLPADRVNPIAAIRQMGSLRQNARRVPRSPRPAPSEGERTPAGFHTAPQMQTNVLPSMETACHRRERSCSPMPGSRQRPTRFYPLSGSGGERRKDPIFRFASACGWRERSFPAMTSGGGW